MESKSLVHVFLFSFPGHGHTKPLLRLGRLLASKGLLVTFSTVEIFGKRMRETSNDITEEPTPVGDGFIRFEFFDDGWEEDEPRRMDLDQYLVQLELVGRQVIPQFFEKYSEQGRPVSCIINNPFTNSKKNNPFIPWVSDVATSLGVPSAMLWVQSCACFAAYYHYYHGLVRFPDEENPEINVQLPCMPLLRHDEVPSFLHPSTPFPFVRRAILGQYKNMDKLFCIFMETFEELEQEIVDYMSKLYPIKTIGPLFRYTDKASSSKTTVRGDCIEWLDTKPPSSVVYISFGTVVFLKQEQLNEIAYGLLNTGFSFLWVIRQPPEQARLDLLVLPDGFSEKAGDKGKVVEWSPQEEVLAHPSVSCFVTHCGWNSSLEALASGIPVVTFPSWGDKVTNAKYLADVFKVGVRLSRGEAENKLVRRDEIESCLFEATVGPKAAEMKQNALKWKEKSKAAVADGGSSYRNIENFVDELKKKCSENKSTALSGIDG